MIIETGINPNCSEATIRIRTGRQNPTKVAQLVTKLQVECGNDPFWQDRDNEWDTDDHILKEYDWSEASVWQETIFGIDCITVKGDAPYNCGEELEKVIKQYLPKAETEWSGDG